MLKASKYIVFDNPDLIPSSEFLYNIERVKFFAGENVYVEALPDSLISNQGRFIIFSFENQSMNLEKTVDEIKEWGCEKLFYCDITERSNRRPISIEEQLNKEFLLKCIFPNLIDKVKDGRERGTLAVIKDPNCEEMGNDQEKGLFFVIETKSQEMFKEKFDKTLATINRQTRINFSAPFGVMKNLEKIVNKIENPRRFIDFWSQRDAKFLEYYLLGDFIDICDYLYELAFGNQIQQGSSAFLKCSIFLNDKENEKSALMKQALEGEKNRLISAKLFANCSRNDFSEFSFEIYIKDISRLFVFLKDNMARGSNSVQNPQGNI